MELAAERHGGLAGAEQQRRRAARHHVRVAAIAARGLQHRPHVGAPAPQGRADLALGLGRGGRGEAGLHGGLGVLVACEVELYVSTGMDLAALLENVLLTKPNWTVVWSDLFIITLD